MSVYNLANYSFIMFRILCPEELKLNINSLVIRIAYRIESSLSSRSELKDILNNVYMKF